MHNGSPDRRKWFLIGGPFLGVLLALFLSSRFLASAPSQQIISMSEMQPAVDLQDQTLHLLNGKTRSLSWIVGKDCQNGMAAYLQTAATNPDAALVGTGWVDPTTGELIDGQSNNCAPGSLSMDNVVKLVHSKGGMAYLTVTMQTDGTAGSWSTRQQTAYIVKALHTPAFIDILVHEIQRAHYDGMIMDLEGTDVTYPNIQQIFAQFNQRVWRALQPLHIPYGIALIHKLSDHDDYYALNGFENWTLLAHVADFIVVMAVDQSYFTPGPCVSVPWLKQLLAYTLKTMPAMLPRIIWELPLYGNSWHRTKGGWSFEATLSYQEAATRASQIPQGQIDAVQSNLNDPYAPHVVYTDDAGVTHSLWYPNALALHAIISDFWQALRQQPQFGDGQFQFAVWWRTTSEPPNFWRQVDTLY